MSELGKILVVAGLIMAAAGALLWAGVGRNWLGRFKRRGAQADQRRRCTR